MSEHDDSPLRSLRCPTCAKPVGMPGGNRAFPFCSDRCRLVDLGRWVDGRYALDPRTGKLDIVDPPDEAESTPEDGTDRQGGLEADAEDEYDA
jgi:endogenous inhibitor of DNA gyrase (YacG/DUF329 family)